MIRVLRHLVEDTPPWLFWPAVVAGIGGGVLLAGALL